MLITTSDRPRGVSCCGLMQTNGFTHQRHKLALTCFNLVWFVPLQRTVRFCRQLATVIPNAHVYYRRGLALKKIIPQCVARNFTYLMVINEDRLTPSILTSSQRRKENLGFFFFHWMYQQKKCMLFLNVILLNGHFKTAWFSVTSLTAQLHTLKSAVFDYAKR